MNSRAADVTPGDQYGQNPDYGMMATAAALAAGAGWASGAFAGGAGAGGASVAGTPFQASGEYGAIGGSGAATGAIPAGAFQASGEYGAAAAAAGAGAGGATSSLIDPAGGNVASAVGGSGAAAGAGSNLAGGAAETGASIVGGSKLGSVLDFLPTIVNGGLSLLGNQQTQNSIDDAVGASERSTQAQIDYARETRDLLLKQAQPWTDAANSALPKLLQMAGISSGTGTGTGNGSGLGPGSVGSPATNGEAGLRENGTTGAGYDITQDPSYAFRRDESMRALEGSAAARGGLMSGGFAKNALDLAGNMASTEYQNIFNRVATIAGFSPLNTTSNAIQNASNTTTNAIGNQGNTLASAFIGSGNSNANTLNQLATIFGSNWKTYTQGKP